MTRGEALLAWHRSNARKLPWRGTRDPYRILVSEVMLQQTQVRRVIPAYERFLDAFPTVDSLAAADLDGVLAAWSGLGYNTRARRLRDAARIVVRDGWPADSSTLEALPEVVAEVGNRIPVYVDGGFRRGADIFKALALGAKAVGVGRPYIWGLGAFGQAGVDRVLEILQGELKLAMGNCGTQTVADITRAYVAAPNWKL